VVARGFFPLARESPHPGIRLRFTGVSRLGLAFSPIPYKDFTVLVTLTDKTDVAVRSDMV